MEEVSDYFKENSPFVYCFYWSEIPMELIFNPCGEFQWSLEGPVSHTHSPHLHVGAPGIFSDLLRSVQMLERVGCRKQWEATAPIYPYLLIPEFTVEDLPLSRTLWWWWWSLDNNYFLMLGLEIIIITGNIRWAQLWNTLTEFCWILKLPY